MIAIVIPAYKMKFLEQTLQAFANQTCKDFNIYIGDDCSPEDLQIIVLKFVDKLNIAYHRFDENIGSRDLVKQWMRCISLTKEEPWIWLFSDDDLVDANCIEQFYIHKDKYSHESEIYRFNNTVIDETNKIVRVTNRSPYYEESEVMAYYLLKGERGNSLADHIFSRAVYNRNGGLVHTDYAQGADWAMSILFSKQKGIVTIPNSEFYWRLSLNNISSNAFKTKNSTIEGHIQFIRWVVNHFDYLRIRQKSEVSYNMIQEATLENFKNVLILHYRGYGLRQVKSLFTLLNETLNQSYSDSIRHLIDIRLLTIKRSGFQYRLINVIRKLFKI